jgi:hypothetical protein
LKLGGRYLRNVWKLPGKYSSSNAVKEIKMQPVVVPLVPLLSKGREPFLYRRVPLICDDGRIRHSTCRNSKLAIGGTRTPEEAPFYDIIGWLEPSL